MASPVAVVDARFCVPCTLPLTVTMNLTVGGAVNVGGVGSAALRVDAPLLGMIRRFVLADAAGRPIVTVQKKALRWEAFRGDSWDARDLLFSARRSPFLQVWTQMAVFLPPKTAWQPGAACDFTMKCGYLDRSCDVYLGKSGTKIAHVRRHFSAAGVLLGREKFSVTVSPNVDYVFVAALVVMLSEIVHKGVQADDGYR